MPSVEWTNVFHFTKGGNQEKQGDEIPALWISKDGFFRIDSTVSNKPNRQDINKNFQLGKQYQIAIKQSESGGSPEDGKYIYEIFLDNVLKYSIENTVPENFHNVKLYTSDPWSESFDSDIGSICNFNIIGMMAMRIKCFLSDINVIINFRLLGYYKRQPCFNLQ